VKKVLIITYYWPPSGGGGVQRWLKFVKYLRDYGWEPIVYTPQNPDFELQDKSLLQDIPNGMTILKRPIWEPFSMYRLLLGKKAVQKQGVVANTSGSVFSRLSVWIRGNFFIPDARVFWVRPSVNYLTKYLKANPVDVLITTGPPHSLHLIGLEIKKRIGVKWLADFRDPWSKWDVLDQLSLSKQSRKSHYSLEQSVLKNADQIIVVSPSLKASLVELGARNIDVITNGYDFEPPVDYVMFPDKFRVSHVGLLNQGRNPIMLWQALNEIADSDINFANDLEIHLSGTIESEVIDSIEALKNLSGRYIYKGYLNHDEVIEVYSSSVILLLLVNNTNNAKWILPGKMFEYIAYGKPILALGKTISDASDVLIDSGNKPCFEFNDIEGIRKFILAQYENFKNNQLPLLNDNTGKFHRKELTKLLAACLDKL